MVRRKQKMMWMRQRVKMPKNWKVCLAHLLYVLPVRSCLTKVCIVIGVHSKAI